MGGERELTINMQCTALHHSMVKISKIRAKFENMHLAKLEGTRKHYAPDSIHKRDFHTHARKSKTNHKALNTINIRSL